MITENEAVILDEDEELEPLKIKIKKRNIINRFIKRTIDIIAGLVGIILLIPISIVVWILRIVKKENDGPMFYEHLRIGKNGKQFRMYKFRSMCMNADEKLKTYLEENPEAKKEYRKYKKLKDDPRVTKIGKFIRKTSIDEFPQFVNVLKGDMSLVGPRPYLPREIDDMGKAYPYITAVKPGVTGLWQVSGRNDVTFEERLDLDIQYYKQKGIKSDMKLLGKTVKKVAFKEGAR